MPKNDPLKSPKATVAPAHIVANHAARRIMPGFGFFRSIHSPMASSTSP